MKVLVTIVMTLLLAASSARGQDEFDGDAALYDNDALLRATLSDPTASADGEIIGFDFGVRSSTAAADAKQAPSAMPAGLPAAGGAPAPVMVSAASTAVSLPAVAWGGLGLMLGLTGMRFYRRWTRPEALSL